MDASAGKRAYRDLQQHIEELKARDLLYVIDEPVNKDTEMSALVRWQFRGGLREDQRKAFLFNNVTRELSSPTYSKLSCYLQEFEILEPQT